MGLNVFANGFVHRPAKRIMHLSMLLGLLLCVGLFAGCGPKQWVPPKGEILRGHYDLAQAKVASEVVDKKGDRRYMLSRMRLGVLSLDAQQPQQAEGVLAEVYDILRTQGVNADKTVQTVVFNEGVRYWKGEPFEQALAITYFGLTEGVLGSWDNVRAASRSSLFYLRDFGEQRPGRSMSTYDVAVRAAQDDQQGSGDYLDKGYAVEASDYVLGYVMHGVASRQLGRPDEAADYFRRAREVNPRLSELVSQLEHGTYNTVLVATWGLGPYKASQGPNNEITHFVPQTPSTSERLWVTHDDGTTRSWPVVTDVNRMAMDHRWNNLEQIRIAKSSLGQAMTLGGLVTTGVGVNSGNDTVAGIGLGVALLGLYLQSQARANLDHCDVFPQRFYVVPLQIDAPESSVTLRLGDRAQSVLHVDGLTPPRPGTQATLIYRRVPTFQDMFLPSDLVPPHRGVPYGQGDLAPPPAGLRPREMQRIEAPPSD